LSKKLCGIKGNHGTELDIDCGIHAFLTEP